MKRKKGLGIALACLLALSVVSCGEEGSSRESDAARGSQSGSGADGAEDQEQGGEDVSAWKDPTKDEPALDWSEVPTAPKEDFSLSHTTIGPKDNAVKGWEIHGYLGEGGAVKIADSYDGEPVILIDKRAFTGTNVTDVYFETEGFVYVQSWAFQDCTSLNSVVIKGNEESEIRSYAFKGCTNLTSVVLSEEITKITGNPFKDTPWYVNKAQETPLLIVNNVVLDGKQCTGDVRIPEGVTKIEESAFSENENITSITLPDSIRRIEAGAFSLCPSLTRVNLPDGLEVIPGGVYGNPFGGSEKVVVTYKGKEYTYEEIEELITLIQSQE